MNSRTTAGGRQSPSPDKVPDSEEPRAGGEAPAERQRGALAMRIVLLVLGAAVITASFQYGLFDDKGHVGAGFMPFVAGLVMTLASVWDIVKSRHADGQSGVQGEAEETEQGALSAAGSGSNPTVGSDEAVGDDADALHEEIRAELEGEEQQAGWKAVLSVFGVLIGVVVLSSVIGLLLTLSLMVFVLLLFVEKKPWWAALIGFVLAFAFGYLVFGQLLGVSLPKGLLGLV